MNVRIWLNEQCVNNHIVPGSWHQQSSPFSSSPKVLLSRHNSAQSLGGVKDTNLVCILWQVWRSPTLMRNERMFVRLQSISHTPTYVQTPFLPQRVIYGGWTNCTTLHFIWEQNWWSCTYHCEKLIEHSLRCSMKFVLFQLPTQITSVTCSKCIYLQAAYWLGRSWNFEDAWLQHGHTESVWSYTIGSWELLSHAQNAVRWLALIQKVSRSSSKALSLCVAILRSTAAVAGKGRSAWVQGCTLWPQQCPYLRTHERRLV